MKQLMVVIAAIVTFACSAATKQLTPQERKEKEKKEYEAFLRETGGMLTDKRGAVGSIAIIDVQKK